MKRRSPDETLKAYENHLRQSQANTNSDGSVRHSQVLRLGRRALGRHEWVEAVHLNSEVNGYLTHYLATTTAHLGVLVTFSALEREQKKLMPQIEQMIETLLIYENPRHGPSL